MHRVVSSGLLTDSPDAGLFSLDAAVRKLFALPRTLVAAYHDEAVWEALWQATLQTYQGCAPFAGVKSDPACGSELRARPRLCARDPARAHTRRASGGVWGTVRARSGVSGGCRGRLAKVGRLRFADKAWALWRAASRTRAPRVLGRGARQR